MCFQRVSRFFVIYVDFYMICLAFPICLWGDFNDSTTKTNSYASRGFVFSFFVARSAILNNKSGRKKNVAHAAVDAFEWINYSVGFIVLLGGLASSFFSFHVSKCHILTIVL